MMKSLLNSFLEEGESSTHFECQQHREFETRELCDTLTRMNSIVFLRRGTTRYLNNKVKNRSGIVSGAEFSCSIWKARREHAFPLYQPILTDGFVGLWKNR